VAIFSFLQWRHTTADYFNEGKFIDQGDPIMKHVFFPTPIHLALTAGLALLLWLNGPTAQPLAAAELLLDASAAPAFDMGFTYQGMLTDGGKPANGRYDFRFQLLAEGGIVGQEYSAEDVQVTDGLFSTTVGITGAGMWNGQRRFLAVAARADGETDYVVIGDPVEVQPAPYAFYARQAAAAAMAGTAQTAATLQSGQATVVQVATFAMAESDGTSTLTFAAKGTGRLEVKRPSGAGDAFVFIPVDVPSQLLGMNQKLSALSFCYNGHADNTLGTLAGIQEAGVRQINQLTVSALLAATYNSPLNADDTCVTINATTPVAVDGSLWVRFKITASPVALEFGEIKLTFTN